MRGITLVQGHGVNDSAEAISRTEWTGEYDEKGNKKRVKVWKCPYYHSWANMLYRVYSKENHKRRPTYNGCEVAKEWLLFSNFKSWMIQQDWEGKSLDKDLLSQGKRGYFPETCVFIDKTVNNFILSSNSIRGKYLVGVCWSKVSCKYQAYCGNPFTNKREHVGLYNTEVEAHLAWKKHKHHHAIMLADSVYVSDDRVRKVLRDTYINFEKVESHIFYGKG